MCMFDFCADWSSRELQAAVRSTIAKKIKFAWIKTAHLSILESECSLSNTSSVPKGLFGRGMDGGEASFMIEKSQKMVHDASARAEYYTRAKEVLWMEDKKDSRLALALKKSDKLYNEYNQRLNIHTSREPRPAAYIPDAFVNKEFWSQESCILQERLSEMAICDGSHRVFNKMSHDNLSLHFPQYTELDRLLELDDDIHVLPTFYRYNQWKKVCSPRNEKNDRDGDISTQHEGEDKGMEDVGIRHLHSRYFYYRELLSSKDEEDKKMKNGGTLSASLMEETEEHHKRNKRFELRVDEIPPHEIARVANEMHEEIEAEYVTMHETCKVNAREKYFHKKNPQSHRLPLKFLGILKAVTGDNRPHLRPLLCDTDIEIAMNEMLDTSIFKYACIQTPTFLKPPLFRDTSCYFRLTYDYIEGISWYVISLKTEYLEMCSLDKHDTLLPLLKHCLCPCIFPTLFEITRVTDLEILDRQLVNAGMEILKKAQKIDNLQHPTILRFFEVYFDRVYEERESPVVNDKLLKVTSHPNESVVMTIPTYRLYQIGETCYVDSYISQRRNAVPTLTNLTVHRLHIYHDHLIRQKKEERELRKGNNVEDYDDDDDDDDDDSNQDDGAIIKKLKKMDIVQIVDRCNGYFFENVIETGGIKIRRQPEDRRPVGEVNSSTLLSPTYVDEEERKYYDGRQYEKAEKLVERYKELKQLKEREREQVMGEEELGEEFGSDEVDWNSTSSFEDNEDDDKNYDDDDDDDDDHDYYEMIKLGSEDEENNLCVDEKQYGSMLEAFRRGIAEGKREGQIYCEYVGGAKFEGDNEDWKEIPLDSTIEKRNLKASASIHPSFSSLLSTKLHRIPKIERDDTEAQMEITQPHLTVEQYQASAQAMAAEKEAKRRERKYYIQDSNLSEPRVLLSFLDEWRAHLDKLESVDNAYPPDAEKSTYHLWSDRMCIEALYDFATHLPIEDMFNNRNEWHSTAKNIQRQLKGYKEKLKDDSTPYDIQQCGRDNIEEFLRQVNPALAMLIREKILIEWRKRHGRGKPRKRKKKRRKRKKERRQQNEEKEDMADKVEALVEKEEKKETIVPVKNPRRTYEFSGWVRRLSTLITKALEFRFSETRRKRREAVVVKTTNRTPLTLKTGILDAAFTEIDESPMDDIQENINDTDEESTVYEEILAPIAPKSSFWGTQDPIQCKVRTQTKIRRKSIDNMSDITNSPKFIAFSIPGAALSPTAIDEDFTDSDNECPSKDDTSSTNTMDHIATRRYTRQYTEALCDKLMNIALKNVIESGIIDAEEKSQVSSIGVNTHRVGIPETNDINDGCIEFLDDATAADIRAQSLLDDYREQISRNSDRSINTEDYWTEYVEAVKNQSDKYNTIEHDVDQKVILNCNTVLDLPTKPMIVQLGNRLQSTMIYDSLTRRHVDIRASQNSKVQPTECEQKTHIMERKTGKFASNSSIKSKSTPVSTDGADGIIINSPPEILITQKQRSSIRSGLVKKSLFKAQPMVDTVHEEMSKKGRHEALTKSRPSRHSDSLFPQRFTLTGLGTSDWRARLAINSTLEPHEPHATRPTQPLSPFHNSSMMLKDFPNEPLKISAMKVDKEMYDQRQQSLQQRRSSATKKAYSREGSHRVDVEAFGSSNESESKREINEGVKLLGIRKKLSSVTVDDILTKLNLGS